MSSEYGYFKRLFIVIWATLFISVSSFVYFNICYQQEKNLLPIEKDCKILKDTSTSVNNIHIKIQKSKN
jgi:hypothetical protein